MRHALALLFVLALLIPAQAQTPPEAREIDTRLLTDSTSSGDYGGAGGALDAGAHDLLSLDVREVLHASFGHAILFRLIVSGGDPSQGDLTDTLYLRSGGVDRSFSFTITAAGLTHSFGLLEGPFEAGDATAYDLFLAPESLGIRAGAAINNIRVESHVSDSIADIMPGTWYAAGQLVPTTDPVGEPASYTTKGPATLLTLSTAATILDTTAGSVTVDLSLDSATTSTDQVVALRILAPDGVTAALDQSQVTLEAGARSPLALSVSGQGLGEIRVLATSDLHGYALLSLPLLGNVLSGYDNEVKSGDLLAGDAFQYRIGSVGTFEYHCHPHPWMMGNVTVKPAVNGTAPSVHTIRVVEPDASDPQTWAFEPRQIDIKLGDVVVWTNQGQMIHDVHGNLGHAHDHSHHDDTDSPKAKESPIPVTISLLALMVLVLMRRK